MLTHGVKNKPGTQTAEKMFKPFKASAQAQPFQEEIINTSKEI